MLKDYWRFINIVYSDRYNIFHFNPEMDIRSLPRELVFIIILIVFRKNRSLVFFHGWNWPEYRFISRHLILRFIFSYMLNKATRIFLLSSKFKDALVNIGVQRSKIFTITTMFDGDLIANALTDVRKEDIPPYVIFLSRFVQEKGGYELLEAFSLIHAGYPAWRLVMVGDGPEFLGMQKLSRELGISQKVDFTGFLRGKAKMRALVLARIFALPTNFHEGLPVAILEGMGAGLPLLTSRVGGLRDILRDPDNGVLLDVVSPATVATGLKVLMSNPVHARKIGKNNYEQSWSRYESRVLTKRIASMYAEILGVPAPD